MSTIKPNKLTVDRAIVKLSTSGKLPEVSEIEAFTGLAAITIIRNLDKDYPKELFVTKVERVILDAYKENHSLKAISDKTGISYYDVSNTISRLKKKGLIKDHVKKSWGAEKTTYIEIVRDVMAKAPKGSNGEKISLKGARGYIDENDSRAVVYLNRISYRVAVKVKDYRVVGGKG